MLSMTESTGATTIGQATVTVAEDVKHVDFKPRTGKQPAETAGEQQQASSSCIYPPPPTLPASWGDDATGPNTLGSKKDNLWAIRKHKPDSQPDWISIAWYCTLCRRWDDSKHVGGQLHAKNTGN